MSSHKTLYTSKKKKKTEVKTPNKRTPSIYNFTEKHFWSSKYHQIHVTWFVWKQIHKERHKCEEIHFYPTSHTWIGTLSTARFRSVSRFSRRKAAGAAPWTRSGWWRHNDSATRTACSVRARKECSSPCWKRKWRSRWVWECDGGLWAFHPMQLTFKQSLCYDRKTDITSLSDTTFPRQCSSGLHQHVC